MTRIEHLLWILAEECAEVAQRVSKAARFGLKEVQPGQSLTNEERITEELQDLFTALDMLSEEGVFSEDPDGDDVKAEEYMDDAVAAKKAKVEKFLEYSRKCGTLT